MMQQACTVSDTSADQHAAKQQQQKLDKAVGCGIKGMQTILAVAACLLSRHGESFTEPATCKVGSTPLCRLAYAVQWYAPT